MTITTDQLQLEEISGQETLHEAELRARATSAFCQLGYPDPDARELADHLVRGKLRITSTGTRPLRLTTEGGRHVELH